jgi:hypothetical protein
MSGKRKENTSTDHRRQKEKKNFKNWPGSVQNICNTERSREKVYIVMILINKKVKTAGSYIFPLGGTATVLSVERSSTEYIFS